MAVGVIEVLGRRARQQEPHELAVVDELGPARGDALVVVAVVPVEEHAVDAGDGGIVEDVDERGHHRGADLVGEGLALGLVLLAVALDAVAEDLVEVHRRGAALEHGGAGERIGDGGVAQGLELGDEAIDAGDEVGLVRERGGIADVDDVDVREIHAVVGLGGRAEDDARVLLAALHLGALVADEVARARGGDEPHLARQDVRVALEGIGHRAHAGLPRGLIDRERRGGLDRDDGCLLGEIGGVVLGGGGELQLRLGVLVLRGRLLERGVGRQPQRRGDRLGVVVDRQRLAPQPARAVAGHAGRWSVAPVVVVEVAIADAHLEIEDAIAIAGRELEGPAVGDDLDGVGLGDAVADVVRLARVGGEGRGGARELAAHRDEDGRGLARGRGVGPLDADDGRGGGRGFRGRIVGGGGAAAGRAREQHEGDRQEAGLVHGPNFRLGGGRGPTGRATAVRGGRARDTTRGDTFPIRARPRAGDTHGPRSGRRG